MLSAANYSDTLHHHPDLLELSLLTEPFFSRNRRRQPLWMVSFVITSKMNEPTWSREPSCVTATQIVSVE
jgi:hypothetical protein